MANVANLDKGFMEGLEIGIFQLVVVEAEKVVHDDIAGQGRKRMGEVEWLSTLFKLVYAAGKRIDMAVDDVDEVDD